MESLRMNLTRFNRQRMAGLIVMMTVLLAAPTAYAQISDAERSFTLEVLPLLQSKCFGCHGADDDLKGEFDARTREALLRGGESEEPSIIPGDPDASPLVHAIEWEGLEMPPKENDRLTAEQIQWVRQWIAAGAPWPNSTVQDEIRAADRQQTQNADGMIVETSGGTSAEWDHRRYRPEEIWAFQTLREKSQIADVGDKNPIDFFIDKKLEAEKLAAAGKANARTLIRRAYMDLTGLPPSPAAIHEFIEAWEKAPKKAWDELLEDLLEQPSYGERWGQHWLDVVRYADTAGFSNDYERSNAWRYRDYVIRSFNDDKPYNQFVMEQIAGDELRPDDPEAVVATGFLRMGPWGTAMVPIEEARQIYRDDLVHNVGQAFLSLPLRCCKCHDHKFDPIPTRDYYRLYAAFSATQPAEMPAAFLPNENREDFEDDKQLVEDLLEFADSKRLEIVAKREAAAKKWYAENNLPYKSLEQRKNDPEDQKPPRHVGLDYVDEGRLKVREQDAWIWKRRLERFQPLAQSVYNGPDAPMNSRRLRSPKKMDKDWRPESFILGGGALTAKQDAVTPGVLSATNFDAEVPEALQGRRLAVARWIADDRNPLTARSFVNRVWQYHFGKGIVGTPNNLGVKGDPPTHPDLLDWLAVDFIENGWKVKRLHRIIMSSDAYQRSGRHPDIDQLREVDPDNQLLAYFTPRRLTAEEIRDSLLVATGELNTAVGGLPVRPEINMEVALEPRMIQFSIAPAHQASRKPSQRNRRSIYAYRVRGQADPFLEIMNLPNPNESCQTRDVAAVTPQVFALMNSDVMTDRSIAMALRLKQECQTEDDQVRRAWQLALGRLPTSDELELVSEYLAEMQTYHEQQSPDPKPYPTRVTRSLVEEFSGKPFEYEEWLAVYEDYVPDEKPWTVDASTRALADACLLLFNSNEFMYIY